jgi:DNA-binding CsgD family transcriptional regulator
MQVSQTRRAEAERFHPPPDGADGFFATTRAESRKARAEPTSDAPAAAELVAHALAALGLAAFVCDPLGRVLAITPAARSALAERRILLIGGRLRGHRPRHTCELDTAIRTAASSVGKAQSGALPIVLRRERDPARLEVLDVIGLSVPGARPAAAPQVIVLLRGRPPDRSDAEAILVRGYHLTSAEAQIAARLALGEARETIAAGRGSSLQTVRTQIRTIFAKLGVTRERELTARVRQILGR